MYKTYTQLTQQLLMDQILIIHLSFQKCPYLFIYLFYLFFIFKYNCKFFYTIHDLATCSKDMLLYLQKNSIG